MSGNAREKFDEAVAEFVRDWAYDDHANEEALADMREDCMFDLKSLLDSYKALVERENELKGEGMSKTIGFEPEPFCDFCGRDTSMMTEDDYIIVSNRNRHATICTKCVRLIYDGLDGITEGVPEFVEETELEIQAEEQVESGELE